ncbi:DUF4083 family protein [Salibacterium sp. K-3]
MPEAVYWGDVVFSLITLLVVITIIVLVIFLLVNVVSKRKSETREMNQKLDRIISLLEQDDGFRK